MDNNNYHIQKLTHIHNTSVLKKRKNILYVIQVKEYIANVYITYLFQNKEIETKYWRQILQSYCKSSDFHLWQTHWICRKSWECSRENIESVQGHKTREGSRKIKLIYYLIIWFDNINNWCGRFVKQVMNMLLSKLKQYNSQRTFQFKLVNINKEHHFKNYSLYLWIANDLSYVLKILAEIKLTDSCVLKTFLLSRAMTWLTPCSRNSLQTSPGPE